MNAPGTSVDHTRQHCRRDILPVLRTPLTRPPFMRFGSTWAWDDSSHLWTLRNAGEDGDSHPQTNQTFDGPTAASRCETSGDGVLDEGIFLLYVSVTQVIYRLVTRLL